MMVWEVALVVLILVLTVLILLLIPTIIRLYRALGKLSVTLDEINRDLPEILDHISEITDHSSRATRKINGVVGDIVEFEQRLSGEIKQPALEFFATMGGILSGLQTFFTYFVRRRK